MTDKSEQKTVVVLIRDKTDWLSWISERSLGVYTPFNGHFKMKNETFIPIGPRDEHRVKGLRIDNVIWTSLALETDFPLIMMLDLLARKEQ